MSQRLYCLFITFALLSFSHNSYSVDEAKRPQSTNFRPSRSGWFNKNCQTKVVKAVKKTKPRIPIKFRKPHRFLAFVACLVGLLGCFFSGSILLAPAAPICILSGLQALAIGTVVLEGLPTIGAICLSCGSLLTIFYSIFHCLSKTMYIQLEVTEDEVKKLNSIGF